MTLNNISSPLSSPIRPLPKGTAPLSAETGTPNPAATAADRNLVTSPATPSAEMGALPWEMGSKPASSKPAGITLRINNQTVFLDLSKVQPGRYQIIPTPKGIQLIRISDRGGSAAPGPSRTSSGPSSTVRDRSGNTPAPEPRGAVIGPAPAVRDRSGNTPAPEPSKPVFGPTDPKKPVFGPIDPGKPVFGPIDPGKPVFGPTPGPSKPVIGPTDPKKPVIGPTPEPSKPVIGPTDPKKPVVGPTDPGKPDAGPVEGGGGTAPARQGMLAKIKSLLPAPVQGLLDKLGAKLDQLDLSGKSSMLDHLYKIADQGLNSKIERMGLTAGEILADAVKELDNPGLIHQSNRGTCAATTVQYYMATNHPAEYAKLVSGLVCDGEAKMASGNKLLLDPGSISRDNSTRNHVDRMLQTALMDRSDMGDYSNATDRRTNGSSGMTQDDVTRLMNDVTSGTDGAFRTYNGNSSDIINRISQNTARGVEVPVGMKWAVQGMHAAHEMLVTKIENGKVYLRNPWGKDENGSTYMGPNRQVLNNSGDVVMSLADFQANLLVSTMA